MEATLLHWNKGCFLHNIKYYFFVNLEHCETLYLHKYKIFIFSCSIFKTLFLKWFNLQWDSGIVLLMHSAHGGPCFCTWGAMLMHPESHAHAPRAQCSCTQGAMLMHPGSHAHAPRAPCSCTRGAMLMHLTAMLCNAPEHHAHCSMLMHLVTIHSYYILIFVSHKLLLQF